MRLALPLVSGVGDCFSLRIWKMRPLIRARARLRLLTGRSTVRRCARFIPFPEREQFLIGHKLEQEIEANHSAHRMAHDRIGGNFRRLLEQMLLEIGPQGPSYSVVVFISVGNYITHE